MSKIDGLNQPSIKEYSQKEYIKYLNEVGNSLSEDEYIIGGKMRKVNNNYGMMMYLHDKIAFFVWYNEWKREKQGHL